MAGRVRVAPGPPAGTVGGIAAQLIRRITIALLVLCQSTQSLIFGGVALFLPLIRADLHLTFSQGGALAAATSLTYAAMQIPSGYLADRFTPRRLFLIGLLGCNTMALLFSVLTSYELLLVNQALAGVFRSLVFAPGLLLMGAQFPASKRATAMGLFVAGGFSSNVLLSSLGPLLVGPLGWRLLFVLFACGGLLMTALYRFVGDATVDRVPPPRLRDLPNLLREPVLWVTGFIQFVRLGVSNGFNFWLPTYLVADRGYALTTAGLAAALAAAMTAPSNVIGGYLSDRLGRPLVVIGGSVAALTVGLATLTYVPGLVPLLVVVALVAMFVQVYFGPLFAVPIGHLGQERAGVMSGLGNFWANLGGFAFVYVLGAVRDATDSFRGGFLALAVACALSTAATVLLSRILRRSAGRRGGHVVVGEERDE